MVTQYSTYDKLCGRSQYIATILNNFEYIEMNNFEYIEMNNFEYIEMNIQQLEDASPSHRVRAVLTALADNEITKILDSTSKVC
jgi:amino acid permease